MTPPLSTQLIAPVNDDLFARIDRALLCNTQGLKYVDFLKTLTPRWAVAWSHIALGWLALGASYALIYALSGRSTLSDIALAAVGSIANGFIIAYLMLFFHEASHYNLHPDKSTNDLLCNVFVSGMVGQDIRNYRQVHWDHHKHLGTVMDTEITYFDPLNIGFLVQTMLGIRTLKVIQTRLTRSQSEPVKRTPKSKSIPYTLIGGLILNAAYCAVLFHYHQWALMSAHIGGIVIFFPFFAALRQLLEHRDEYADPNLDYTEVAHGAINRLFGDGLIASTLGGAGFNRHLLHHWDPSVSYTQLHVMERYLLDTPYTNYLQKRQTTYWKTFRLLFHWR